MLQKGELGFIVDAVSPSASNRLSLAQKESRLKQLILVNPGAPFYSGLLLDGASSEIHLPLFLAALESPSVPVKREAARKLILTMLLTQDAQTIREVLDFLDSGAYKGKNEFLPALRASCLYRLERYDEIAKPLPENFAAANPNEAENPAIVASIVEWEKILSLFAAWKALPGAKNEAHYSEIKSEILGFLFEGPAGECRDWASDEALSAEGLLDSAENAAVKGRLLGVNYGAAALSLRLALAGGGSVIFRYPSLIAELGRAYQYTPAMRDEGMRLFRLWDTLLETGETFELAGLYDGGAGTALELQAYLRTLDDEALKTRKYLVRFYLARIERSRGDLSSSSRHFLRALELAPDANQSDACIWYILTNAMDREPLSVVSLVRNTASRWSDASYFEDVLDRLSCYLIGRRQWAALMDVFSCLEENGASPAQYAWILGRAVEESYIGANRSAESFFTAVLENEKANFYYRAMAASKLNLSLTPKSEPEPEPEPEPKPKPKTDNSAVEKTSFGTEAQFLLGFFDCGASSLVLPYLRAQERNLSVVELREIASMLNASGFWKESLDLVSRYIGRDDYKSSDHDLLLFYPQHYRELIEKYAANSLLEAEILYGLIRTESYFVADIVSRADAVGLGQLMMPTAIDMAGRIARRGGPDYREGEPDLKNPEINIHLSSFYLRYLIEQMGSPMLALLAYNGGMGRVRRWLASDGRLGSLPHDLFLESIEYRETREYGRRVLSAAAVYGYLYYGKNMEEATMNIHPTVSN